MKTLEINDGMARTVSTALVSPVHAAAKVLAAELDTPFDADDIFGAMFPVDTAPTAENLELIRLSREVVGLASDQAMCIRCWADLVDMYRADVADTDGFVRGAMGDA